MMKHDETTFFGTLEGVLDTGGMGRMGVFNATCVTWLESCTMGGMSGTPLLHL